LENSANLKSEILTPKQEEKKLEEASLKAVNQFKGI